MEMNFPMLINEESKKKEKKITLERGAHRYRSLRQKFGHDDSFARQRSLSQHTAPGAMTENSVVRSSLRRRRHRRDQICAAGSDCVYRWVPMRGYREGQGG
uniref:Uncharacterized protein n=1 Tax=Cacopsylla melanoneura TaxID=428564 RepID=A0A8D8Z9W7_9HEMI